MRVFAISFLTLLVCSAAVAAAVTPIPMSPATMDELTRIPDIAAHHSTSRKHDQLLFPFSAPQFVSVAISQASPFPPPPAAVGFRTLARPNVYPADATSLQVPIAHERDDLAVRNDARLMYLLIGGQELPSASTIADEKFSIDQFMSPDLIETQESIQFDCVGCPVGKEANPYGRIDEHHQATVCFGDGLSRRLGTSCA